MASPTTRTTSLPLRSRLLLAALVLCVAPMWLGCAGEPEVEFVVMGQPPEGVYAFGFARINPDSNLTMEINAGNADLAAYEAALDFMQGFRFRGPDETGQWTLSPARDFGTNRLAMTEITSRDILEMRDRDFMVSQLYIPLDYNLSGEILRSFETATQYRVFIDADHTDASARLTVPQQAVQAALKKHFRDNATPPGGSVWLTAMQPQMRRTRDVPEGRVDLYLDKNVRLESLAGSSTLRYRVELFICEDFIPEDQSRVRSPDPVMPEAPPDYRPRISGGGEVAEGRGMGFGLVFSPPDSPELPFSAKEEAEARALEFLPYMTQGFRFDKEAGTLELLSHDPPQNPGQMHTVAWYGSSSRSFYTAQLLADRTLEIPTYGVARIPVEITYTYDPDDDRVLDNLPRLLALMGIRSVGSNDGIGYFGGDFRWLYEREANHRITIQATLFAFRESSTGGTGPGGREIPPGASNIPGGQSTIPGGRTTIPGGQQIPGDDD